jgi:hypothetical protein
VANPGAAAGHKRNSAFQGDFHHRSPIIYTVISIAVSKDPSVKPPFRVWHGILCEDGKSDSDMRRLRAPQPPQRQP